MTTATATGNKHSLTFSQIVGEFTVDKELLGKQDPYCIFTVGTAKAQTKAIKNVGASAARWTETYTLPDFLPSKGTKLHVDVYNHNSLLPDSLIGGGYVDLATLSQEQTGGSGSPVQVLLTDKKGKSTGVLKFNLNTGGYSSTGAATGATTGRSGAATTGVATGATGAGIGGAGAVSGRTAASEQEAGRGIRAATTTAAAADAGTRTGAKAGTAGAKGMGEAVAVAEGAEVDRAYYTEQQDQAEDQVLVEKFREHRPYVQEYETVVQPTGRVRETGAHVEALGSEVRTVGAEQRQERVDLESRLPAGVTRERPAGEGWVETAPGPVLDATTFEVAGERLTDKERLTQLREHHDLEKEVAVKTYLRERELPEAAGTEVVDRHRERVGPATTTALGSSTTAGTIAGAGKGTAATGYGTGAGTGAGVSSTAGTAGTTTTTSSEASRAEEREQQHSSSTTAHPAHAASHRTDEYAPRHGGQRAA